MHTMPLPSPSGSSVHGAGAAAVGDGLCRSVWPATANTALPGLGARGSSRWKNVGLAALREGLTQAQPSAVDPVGKEDDNRVVVAMVQRDGNGVGFLSTRGQFDSYVIDKRSGLVFAVPSGSDECPLQEGDHLGRLRSLISVVGPNGDELPVRSHRAAERKEPALSCQQLLREREHRAYKGLAVCRGITHRSFSISPTTRRCRCRILP